MKDPFIIGQQIGEIMEFRSLGPSYYKIEIFIRPKLIRIISGAFKPMFINLFSIKIPQTLQKTHNLFSIFKSVDPFFVYMRAAETN